MARFGVVRLGRRGTVGSGKVWQGQAGEVRRGSVGLGVVRRGAARSG